jgi:hypothetical protein
MDEFVWIFVLGAFWLFEIAAKAIKKQSSADSSKPKLSQPDPRASQRELARDVDDGARRAEDALRRWEARQQKAQAKAVARAQAVPQSRRIRAADRRRQAFEAIAAMLAEPAEEAARPEIPASVLPVERPRRPPVTVEESKLPPPPSVRARDPGGVQHLAHLPDLQRAVVLSEILGSPVGLPRSSEARGSF